MFKQFWEKWTDPSSYTEARLRSIIPGVSLRTLERITYKLDQTIAASTLERLLKSRDVNIRDTALEYCQWHHPPKHDDYLTEALFDKTLRIRWKAIRHLSSFPTPKAAARLREMFHSEEERVKPYIMRALSKCEDGQTAPFLYKLLTDKPLSPFAKMAGIGLGSLQAKAFVEPLIQLVNSPETEQAEGAVWALGSMGDPRTIEPLLGLLGENPTKGSLLHSILSILENIPDPRVVDLVLPFVDDERFFIQQAAMGVLAYYQDQRITQAVLKHLSSDNPDLRAVAINALVKIERADVTEPLLAAFERETHPRILLVFARAFSHLGDKRAIPLLELRRRDDDVILKQAFDEALASLKSV